MASFRQQNMSAKRGQPACEDSRRGSESKGAFTDYQPQCPDLQGDFNVGFTGVPALFETIRLNSPPARHTPAAYSVIEEIVEGFVEGISSALFHAACSLSFY
jgi:hypothetical protein